MKSFLKDRTIRSLIQNMSRWCKALASDNINHSSCAHWSPCFVHTTMLLKREMILTPVKNDLLNNLSLKFLVSFISRNTFFSWALLKKGNSLWSLLKLSTTGYMQHVVLFLCWVRICLKNTLSVLSSVGCHLTFCLLYLHINQSWDKILPLESRRTSLGPIGL